MDCTLSLAFHDQYQVTQVLRILWFVIAKLSRNFLVQCWGISLFVHLPRSGLLGWAGLMQTLLQTWDPLVELICLLFMSTRAAVTETPQTWNIKVDPEQSI